MINIETAPRLTKRCHGNRKLRRFKKKCEIRGLTKEETQKLIEEHNRRKNGNQTDLIPNGSNNETGTAATAATTTKSMIIKRKSNKRKRMPTSSSVRSIAQQSPKKIKKTNDPINLPTIKTIDRLPKYLSKAPNLLFQALRLHLNFKLKKKRQQRFLHYRLRLIDQQYRLKLHQNLWQSYSDMGSEHQTWPVSYLLTKSFDQITHILYLCFHSIKNHVYKIAKTNEHRLCQQFGTNRLSDLNRQLDQCTSELITQAESCPSKLLPLDTLDQNLREFVNLQEKYLSNKMHSQLTRYKDLIEEKKLFQNFSSYDLTNVQVSRSFTSFFNFCLLFIENYHRSIDQSATNTITNL